MEKAAESKFVQQEQATIAIMTHLFCRAKHGTRQGLCPDCQELLDYAQERVAHCMFLSEKPVCARCPVHCYKAAQRERIREVMRFSGPRLLFKDPLAVVRHFRMMLRTDSARVARLRKKEETSGS